MNRCVAGSKSLNSLVKWNIINFEMHFINMQTSMRNYDTLSFLAIVAMLIVYYSFT